MAAPKSSSAFSTFLRAAIGLGLAALAIGAIIKHSKVDLRAEFEICNWSLMAVAFGCYACLLAMTMIRWYILLIVQGIHIKAGDIVRLTMIGLFWSGVIPGSVSGDFVKMFYVRKHAGDKLSETVMTIVLDRLLGLMGLFAVASVAILLSLKFLEAAPKELQMAVAVVAGGSVAGLLAVFAIAIREPLQRLPGVRHAIEIGHDRLPEKVTTILTRMSQALDLYRSKPLAVIAALAVSIIGHSCFALAAFSVGKAFAEEVVPLSMYFVTLQVANCVASIPLTPAGLGGRDAVINLFFSALEADHAKAAMVALGLSLIIVSWTAISCFFWIASRKQRDAVEA